MGSWDRTGIYRWTFGSRQLHVHLFGENLNYVQGLHLNEEVCLGQNCCLNPSCKKTQKIVQRLLSSLCTLKRTVIQASVNRVKTKKSTQS